MSSIRFAIGVALMLIGYTALYSGQSNLFSGGHGTGFLAALGFSNPASYAHGPLGSLGQTLGNDIPNMIGNTPQTQPAKPTGVIQGQFYFGP